MTVQICRASGRPVNMENIEKYETEFKALYDKAMLKVGINEKSLINEETGVRINKLLNRLQRILLRKYPTTEDMALPTTEQAWLDLVKQKGPIAIASRTDKQGVALVVMDADFNVGE